MRRKVFDNEIERTEGTREDALEDPISNLQSAQRYADRGWFVFPCGPKKNPYIHGGFKNASRDANDITRWWSIHPKATIGCACGLSGLLVIDLDQKNGKNGIESFASICRHRGIDTSGALRVVTPTGGQHYIFKYDHSIDPIRGKTDLLDRGVDVKGDEGYVILPPSRIETGVYVEDGGDWSQAPAPLPDSLLQLIKEKLGGKSDDDRRRAHDALSKEIATVTSTSEGNRNDQLNKSAFYLGRFVYMGSLSREDVEEGLVHAAQASGLDLGEAIKTVRSGLSAAIEAADRGDLPGVQKKQALTDMGNADFFVETFSEEMRFCITGKEWLEFDGMRWIAAGEEHAMRLAKKAIIILGERAKSSGSEALSNWAKTSQSRSRLEAMTSLARSDVRICVRAEEFDTDQYLFNCTNGVLDLQTGELLPHIPSRKLMKVAGTAYDPSAQCPRWIEFLDKVMNGDKETISYLQRAIGYSLSGITTEQCLFFLHGKGTNGKSTFINTISRMLGDYSIKTNAETLYEKKSDGGMSNDVARLRGARFVSSSEMTNRHLNEGFIKDVTGGDKLAARFLFREYFEFYPEFKLWMYGNDKPSIRGTDDGIWRRIKLIPFSIKLLDEEKDPQLLVKLTDELPGILNWALAGFRDWMGSGLGESTAILSATQAYRSESDHLQAFIDESCVCRAGLECSSNDLYKAFRNWAESAGMRPMSSQKFSAALELKGYERKLESGTKRSKRLGICLQDDPRLQEGPDFKALFTSIESHS